MADRQVRIVIDDLERFAGRGMQMLTLEAHANMAEDTPVDLGWARNNFVPEIGAPFAGTAGTRENIDRGTASAGLSKVLASYRLELGPIFITNNVPYIGRLNDGHSQQAPSGYIQKAIGKAVQTVSGRLRQ